MFTSEVIERLGHYVYRLIDPRNGETFYVGKGSGNRVFAHANGELESDPQNEKLRRIREINQISGLEVQHVIHRHGLSEEAALEVEAALIDAYPAAANIVSGRESDERGVMHCLEIIERHQAPEAVFHHNVLILNVNRSAAEKGLYEAVRFAWKLDPNRAGQADYILAVVQGLIKGVFKAEKWLRATIQNFPGIAVDEPERWGFDGHEAPESIKQMYVGRRLPETLRKAGAANPVRYIMKGTTESAPNS